MNRCDRRQKVRISMVTALQKMRRFAHTYGLDNVGNRSFGIVLIIMTSRNFKYNDRVCYLYSWTFRKGHHFP